MEHSVSDQAASDLDEIWLYVARETGSLEVATRLIDAITDTFLLLARQPLLGRSRSDDFGEGYRSLAVREYVIVYCIEAEYVVILRVVHGRRDLQSLLD